MTIAGRRDAIHVVEHGTTRAGEPLVALVHGSMDRAASFRRVSHHLSDLHTLVYDRRGYGRSVGARPPATSLDDHVDDLLGVLDGRPAIVAGHSYGGDVALGAAARGTGDIRGVVAFEPPMPWAEWWPPESSGSVAIEAASPAEAAEIFMRLVIGDDRWERLSPGVQARRRAEGPALLREMHSIRTGTAPLDLGAVRVPVLAGRGERSAPRHRKSAEMLAQAVEGAELVEIGGAGHGAHLSHPSQFADLVRRLVARG